MDADLNRAERVEAARAELRRAVMGAIGDAMRQAGVSPMSVLGLAAMAVGSIYQEMAQAHHGPGRCCCGWEPDAAADIEALQTVLAATAAPTPAASLLGMRAIGQA